MQNLQKWIDSSRILATLAAIGALTLTLALTACHTVEGAGRDVQSIGEGVEDTAEEVRPYE